MQAFVPQASAAPRAHALCALLNRGRKKSVRWRKLGTFVAARNSGIALRWGSAIGILEMVGRGQWCSSGRAASRMRILFATPEVSDFIQVGGLAAVSAALPRALRDFADVRVIIPGYPAVLRGLQALTP